ncbi:MAG: phycocyanobilin:ferredoxin oxidoreductase [Pseudanabaenaceae cyanobacterium]
MPFHPVIEQLAHQLTTTWQTYLSLKPYALPADLGYVEGKLEGERLTIANTCYQTPQFRKLHLELAQVGTNLDILHCVMFPRPEYPIPIFGCDLVGGRGKISAAIADLSPTVPLSPSYTQFLGRLQEQYQNFAELRPLPSWGEIFSPFCLFTRLHTPAEEALFLNLVAQMVTLHCEIATATPPAPALAEPVQLGISRYCHHQQQNDKTRRILEKAFDPHWAERYMTTVLFDG